jgi:hypothetical protein
MNGRYPPKCGRWRNASITAVTIIRGSFRNTTTCTAILLIY